MSAFGALDLRDHRDRIALFERVCSSRAELHEDLGPECAGANAVRAAVRDRAGRRAGNLHPDRANRPG